jgi:hypothetical protein
MDRKGKLGFCPVCFFYSKKQKFCYFFSLSKDRYMDAIPFTEELDAKEGTFYTDALIVYLKQIGWYRDGKQEDRFY